MAEHRDEGGRSVKSAERVLDLLEFIGETPDGASFSGLNQSLGIPKSSLHALLEVLTNRGYADLDPSTRRYSLGLRTWEAGQAYQRHHDIVREAQPVLAGIVARLNETAQLARLAGRDNVYMAKVDSTHPLRLQSDVGTRLSAHATGVGKALLAQLSDDEVRARFGTEELSVKTAKSIGSMAALLDELARTRQRGFAIDNEEYTPGVFCLAVPVRDGEGPASAAISVSIPVSRVAPDRLGEGLALLAEGSITIAARCGVHRHDPLLQGLAEPAHAQQAIAALIDSGRYRLPLAVSGEQV